MFLTRPCGVSALCVHSRFRRGSAGTKLCVVLAADGFALNVSPQSAHRHAVSFVICFASVPTLIEPHAGQVGRAGSSGDIQPPSGKTFVRPLSTGAETSEKLSHCSTPRLGNRSGPRVVTAAQTFLAGIEHPTIAPKVKHPQRVVGSLGVQADREVPATAVWASHQITNMQRRLVHTRHRLHTTRQRRSLVRAS